METLKQPRADPGMGRRSAPLIFALVGLSLVVLVAAGCGKNKSAAPSTTTAAGSTTSQITTTGTTTAAATTSGTTGLSGIATAANCGQLAGLAASLAKAVTGAGGTDVQKTAAVLQQFANQAPANIRADFQVVAAAYAKIADALKGVNLSAGHVPSAAVLAKLAKLATQLNSAALQKADANITAWAQTNCHP